MARLKPGCYEMRKPKNQATDPKQNKHLTSTVRFCFLEGVLYLLLFSCCPRHLAKEDWMSLPRLRSLSSSPSDWSLPSSMLVQVKRPFQSHTPALQARLLLVHPGIAVHVPLRNAFGKPQGNLLLRGLDRVRAVADVAAHIKAEVTTDSACKTIRARVS